MNEGAQSQFAGEVPHLAGLKFHCAIDERKERVIITALHILSGMKFSSPLADNDIAYCHTLTATDFNAEAFGNRIAA